MKFVQLYGHDEWWELDENQCRLLNYQGGHRYIDENSEEWTGAKVVDLEDWHALYLKYDYNPFQLDDFIPEMWIAPNGDFFDGRAHEVIAEDLLDIVYGIKHRLEGSGDLLIEKGWVKVSATLMHEYYCEAGMYTHLSAGQRWVVKNWSEHYDLSFEEMIHPYN